MTLLLTTLRTASQWLRPSLVAFTLVVMVCGSACGSGPGPTPPPPPPPPAGTGVLVGAGDIATCLNGVISAGLIATANLVETLPGATVFTAGDNAYQNGTAAEYRDCYDPYWGRFKDRTWPVPGNHDYGSAGAAPFFAYFGGAAGKPGEGYWHKTLGTWTVLGLNSDGGNLPAQIQWVKNELSANKTNCALAIWHRPLFSVGINPDAIDMRDTWQALSDLGVDVVVNGHEHLYQRYDPQDVNGNPDSKGMVQFTVGTGGASLYNPAVTHRNSARIISAYGVTRFTLLENAYTWEFINIDKGGESDFGSAACRF